jgi:general secretion pathway protein G
MQKRTRPARAGFTIVEVLVVVTIIALIATVVSVRYFSSIGQAKAAIAKQQLSAIETAVDKFNMDHGRYPETLDELVTRPDDVAEEAWSPALKEKELNDPWGRRYEYRNPGEHWTFDLYSLGADGQEGGTGDAADVVNW